MRWKLPSMPAAISLMARVLVQAGCTLHKEVPVGQQRQHEFVYQVLLANDLLPQPAFKVRKELVVHGSSLCYCCQKWRFF